MSDDDLTMPDGTDDLIFDELADEAPIAVKKLEQKIPTFFMLKLMLTVVRFTFAALKV